ncbi:hypothetical protein [Bradyrhizobium sp. CCBAU 53380]|uniref:hypothetical protein n=1 Tax=Bradyrhizobium sp. CCBAU 53380 TaxID=1325117 RepID=UPI00230470AD|nr:hypothetical protein [Bradyrhizobium sp. CCBAU 53380]
MRDKKFDDAANSAEPEQAQSSHEENSTMLPDCPLLLQPDDLLPGDTLLYRPRAPTLIQKAISSATDSPYTHVAIFLGNGVVAESMFPGGVRKGDLRELLEDSLCIAVLRTQLGFTEDRPDRLLEFVEAVLGNKKFYNALAAARVPSRNRDYFDNQIEFVRKNYGKVTSTEEFAKQSFFCSAFVVACYSVVGIIGETAQAAYQPNSFAPGHLLDDPSFGWLLGYLIPEGGSLPPDDPLLAIATLWCDNQEARWW